MSFHDTRELRRFSAEKMQKVNLFDAPQMFCDVYCLEPGQLQKTHSHEGAAKVYYVVEGRGTFEVGGERVELGPGGLACARSGEPHGVENTSDERLVVLVAMAPNPSHSSRR